MSISFGTVLHKGTTEATLSDVFCIVSAQGDRTVFGVLMIDSPASSRLKLNRAIRNSLTRWNGLEGTDKPLETRFEGVVESTNEAVAQFFKDEPSDLALQDLHLAIGAADLTSLVVTGIGNLRALFFREDQPNTFHIFDLLRTVRDEAPSAEKLFGSLVSGEIKPNDSLVIVSPLTIDLVGDSQLKRQASSEPPATAAHLVRKQLELRDASGTALFLRFDNKPRSVAPPGKKTSHASVVALRKTEALTELFLKGVPRLSIKPLLARLHPPKLPDLRRIFSAIHDAGLILLDILKKLIALRPTGTIERFNVLPRKAKLLSLGALVFAVLMVQSIIFLTYERRVSAARIRYGETITTIEQLITESRASLIYKDEAQASALLNEARKKTEALPLDSKTHKRTKVRLLASVDATLKELRHEISVTPEIVETFPVNQLVTILADGTVALLDDQGTKTALTLAFPAGAPADAELFGTKLYLLVPGAHQIYRLNRRGSTFSGLAPWLRSEAPELANARGLALDGAVYVLGPKEIIKFFTGVREDWKPYIDPPLEDATRIWTDDETQGIYILDKGRIVVLSKQGNLLAQYLFPAGSQITDFVADEALQKLTVRRGDIIEETNLIHLTPK